jgi:hypothetical protein
MLGSHYQPCSWYSARIYARSPHKLVPQNIALGYICHFLIGALGTDGNDGACSWLCRCHSAHGQCTMMTGTATARVKDPSPKFVWDFKLSK